MTDTRTPTTPIRDERPDLTGQRVRYTPADTTWNHYGIEGLVEETNALGDHRITWDDPTANPGDWTWGFDVTPTQAGA